MITWIQLDWDKLRLGPEPRGGGCRSVSSPSQGEGGAGEGAPGAARRSTGARVTSRYGPTSHSVAEWVPRTALSRIPAATKKRKGNEGGRRRTPGQPATGQTEGSGGGKAEQMAGAGRRAVAKPLSRMGNGERGDLLRPLGSGGLRRAMG